MGNTGRGCTLAECEMAGFWTGLPVGGNSGLMCSPGQGRAGSSSYFLAGSCERHHLPALCLSAPREWQSLLLEGMHTAHDNALDSICSTLALWPHLHKQRASAQHRVNCPGGVLLQQKGFIGAIPSCHPLPCRRNCPRQRPLHDTTSTLSPPASAASRNCWLP